METGGGGLVFSESDSPTSPEQHLARMLNAFCIQLQRIGKSADSFLLSSSRVGPCRDGKKAAPTNSCILRSPVATLSAEKTCANTSSSNHRLVSVTYRWLKLQRLPHLSSQALHFNMSSKDDLWPDSCVCLVFFPRTFRPNLKGPRVTANFISRAQFNPAQWKG